MRIKLTLIFALALLAFVFIAPREAQCRQDTSILVLCQKEYVIRIDPDYRDKLTSDGFYIEAIGYDQVTWDILKKFNIVVVYGLAGADAAGKNPVIDDTVRPLIFKFLDAGGGVLFFSTTGNNITMLNKDFLNKMGAAQLNEQIYDPANTFNQKHFLRWPFATTTNIAPNPITKGIDTFIYPIHFTYTMKVNDSWNVLISSDKSAHSSLQYGGATVDAYSSSPPILAVRDYANGRAGFLAMHQMFTIQSGFHRYWEGIVVTEGNGYQLLNNLFDWLAAPSLQSKKVGGYTGEGLGVKQEIQDMIIMEPTIEEQSQPLNVYEGVIGIHSTFSGAEYAPKQWCDKARKLGYDYLVFTEDFAEMNEGKWDELKKVCVELSDSSFVAIPGIEFYDGDKPSQFIAFDFKYWPSPDKIENGRLKNFNYSMFLFTADQTGYANPCAYEGKEFLAFYDSILLNVYDYPESSNVPVEKNNLWDQYMFRNETYCGRNPLTLHRLYNIDDLDKVTGFMTYVWAPSVADIHKSFHFSQNVNLWGHSAFVSNGPIIREFKLMGTGWVYDWWESYYIWNPGDKCKLVVDITNDEPITDVIIYRGYHTFRHFRPNEKDFRAEIDYIFDRGGPFMVMAKDTKNRQAVTTYKNVRHDVWWTHTCTDNQNFIMTGFLPSDNKRVQIYFKGQRRAVVNGLGIAYWGIPGITGWLTTDYQTPEGTEIGGEWGSFSVNTSSKILSDKGEFTPKLYFNEKGATTQHITFDSGDINNLNSVCVYENPAMPELNGKIKQDFTSYGIYSKVNTFNMIYTEKELDFLTDITLGDRDGLEIPIASLGADTALFSDYTYIDETGTVHKGKRDSFDKTFVDTLAVNGPVIIYPQILGNGGIYTLDDNQYNVELAKGGVSIGYDWPGKLIKAGTKLTSRTLIARSSGAATADEDMMEFYDKYGFDGTHAMAPALTHGTLTDSRFFVTLDAEGYYVDGTLPAVTMPASTPIIITGVNANWPVGFYDTKAKSIRRLGVDPDTGRAYYAFDDYGAAKDFVVGNLLVADNTDVVLNLTNYDADSVTFEAHNPTANDITIRINPLKAIDSIPYFETDLVLPAGTSVTKTIEVK